MSVLKRLFVLLLASSPQVLADCSESLRKISNSAVQSAITEVQGLRINLNGGTVNGWAETSGKRGQEECPYYWAPFCALGDPVEPLDGDSQTDNEGFCKEDKAATPSDGGASWGCCDKVKSPGPCINDQRFDSVNVCVKRWEVRSLLDFSTKCQSFSGGAANYGRPYFISALAMKQAGSVKYFQKLEDNNFICIPNDSCDKTGIIKHLKERAQECVKNYMTSCIYWLTDLMIADTDPTTDPTKFERYKKAKPDFGYLTEDACTRAKYYGVVGELEEHATANSDKNGDLKVEQFQSMVAKGTYSALNTDC